MSYKLEKLTGRRIIRVEINSEKDRLNLITPTEQVSLEIIGDCCSSSWLEHVDGIEFLIGGTIQRVEEIASAVITNDADGKTDSYGLKLETNKGVCVLECRNESNGYYSGYFNVTERSSLGNYKPLTEDF